MTDPDPSKNRRFRSAEFLDFQADIPAADHPVAVAVLHRPAVFHGGHVLLHCPQLPDAGRLRDEELAQDAGPGLFLGQLFPDLGAGRHRHHRDDDSGLSGGLCAGFQGRRDGPPLGHLHADHSVLHKLSRADFFLVCDPRRKRRHQCRAQLSGSWAVRHAEHQVRHDCRLHDPDPAAGHHPADLRACEYRQIACRGGLQSGVPAVQDDLSCHPADGAHRPDHRGGVLFHPVLR